MKQNPVKSPACAGLFLFLLLVSSCQACVLPWDLKPGTELPDSFSLVSYNTENLFDDSNDGTEYYDFTPESGWSSALYHTKLLRISRAIREADHSGPEIVLLQEVENGRVVEDLAQGYLKGLGYVFTSVCEEENHAVRTGIISKTLPAAVRTLSTAPPEGSFFTGPAASLPASSFKGLRPMLEVRFTWKGRALYLFSAHWKSRREGAEATEALRRLQARTAARRINEIIAGDPEAMIVFCGDLNESHNEYGRIEGAYQTALLPSDVWESLSSRDRSYSIPVAGSRQNSGLLYSPWQESEFPGSYIFQDEWQTLDHILCSLNLVDGVGFEMSGFTVVQGGDLLNSYGEPLKWMGGIGTSDHLPVMAEFTAP